MDELIPVGRGDDEEGVVGEADDETDAPKGKSRKSRVKAPALA